MSRVDAGIRSLSLAVLYLVESQVEGNALRTVSWVDDSIRSRSLAVLYSVELSLRCQVDATRTHEIIV